VICLTGVLGWWDSFDLEHPRLKASKLILAQDAVTNCMGGSGCSGCLLHGGSCAIFLDFYSGEDYDSRYRTITCYATSSIIVLQGITEIQVFLWKDMVHCTRSK
jgi:hypothetical protein